MHAANHHTIHVRCRAVCCLGLAHHGKAEPFKMPPDGLDGVQTPSMPSKWPINEARWQGRWLKRVQGIFFDGTGTGGGKPFRMVLGEAENAESHD